MNYTPNYVQRRPTDLPSHLPWPNNDTIVDCIAAMSRQKFPPYVSPILFPNAQNTLPPSLTAISPITSSAHPLTRSLMCATLHPNEPSCLKTYLEYYVKSIPMFARFFTVIFTLFALPRYKKFLVDPSKELNRLAKVILGSTISISGSIGTAWGMTCFFQNFLPGKVLPTQRWFWGGFVAGFWAFLLRETGRAQFLYSLRTSFQSLWKLGVKKGYWRPGKNGDVWLVVFGIALLNVVHDHNQEALTSGIFRRVVKTMRGDAEEKPSVDGEKPKDS
jgi:hypothetical protein